MSGFEHQVAGHMLWEGMALEGLAITRAIHDRYHAARRNPWNEVECGDHYARAMASYGVFVAASGFEYHGPRGYLAFAPRLTRDNFKAAFTAAEGWGSYTQRTTNKRFAAEIALKWGNLQIKVLTLTLPDKMDAKSLHIEIDGRTIKATHLMQNTRLVITPVAPIALRAGQKLRVSVL
jgi:hypothetical protein